MKALNEFEQDTLNKSVDMVMKAILESNQDMGKLLNALKTANRKLTATKPLIKMAA